MEAVAASAGCGNPTALAGLKPGERVLDLGSGGGIDCFLAARQVGADGHVIGLDMTPDMLALARRNAETLGVTNVEFLRGSSRTYRSPNRPLTLFISNCVVCLSPDKDAVVSESYRGAVAGRQAPPLGHDVAGPYAAGAAGRRSELVKLCIGRRGAGHVPGPPGRRRVRGRGNRAGRAAQIPGGRVPGRSEREGGGTQACVGA